MLRPLLALLLFAPAAAAADPSPREVFERRLVPIFKSDRPSSCVQCHLAGVDLKDYILPDADRTFRSLRDQGLIDLDAPDRSKILRLIAMGQGDRPAAVHEAARKAEYEAFAAWIRASAADPALRAAPKLDPKGLARPAAPDAVIRHGRTDRLLAGFEQDVWAWRFRCMNCHTEGTPQNDKFRREYGGRVAWVKRDGPAATMAYLLASKLIDPDVPANSLLLRKPLGEDHKGGTKFAVGDDAYKGFRRWVEDVAAVRAGWYAAAADLPPADRGPLRFGTDVWLKLDRTPPEWGDKLVGVRVFAWDAAAGRWEAEPIAVSDRIASAKAAVWQHNLTLVAARGSDRAAGWRAEKPTLPPGRYAVRVYVDGGGRLAKDWTAALGEAEYVGQAEFEARWREGYAGMTAVPADRVRR